MLLVPPFPSWTLQKESHCSWECGGDREAGGGSAGDHVLTLYHFTSARGRDSSHSKVAEPVSGIPKSWGKRSIVTGGSARQRQKWAQAVHRLETEKITHHQHITRSQARALSVA